MVCVYCGGKTQVVNSRRQNRNNQVWRRRQCLRCGAVFSSTESAVLSKEFSVLHHGLLEPFLVDKLYTEILLALQDRPRCYEEAREITLTVVNNIVNQRVNPVGSNLIAQEAAKVLKRFSRRAWLRYTVEHPSLKA